MKIKFVVSSYDKAVLQANTLRSRINPRSLIVLEGYDNVPKAYNSIDKKGSDIIIYMHEDVYLPQGWIQSVYEDLECMSHDYPDWGVVGVAGAKLVDGKKVNRGYIRDRGKEWGSPTPPVSEVDTLDELLLITRGDFTFDENLPLHFYGADICMQAKQRGRKCYAINNYLHHNSTLKVGERTDDFYACERYFRNKWKDYLDIATTCTIVRK